MSRTPHPRIPLQEEERAEILSVTERLARCLISTQKADEELRAIRFRYEKRRDDLHPGWREEHERKLVAWMQQPKGQPIHPPGRTVEQILQEEIIPEIEQRKGGGHASAP
jgi:hypothetical protein